MEKSMNVKMKGQNHADIPIFIYIMNMLIRNRVNQALYFEVLESYDNFCPKNKYQLWNIRFVTSSCF
jgi:hypothetical protein